MEQIIKDALSELYNKYSIEYLSELSSNKEKITNEILSDLRSFGVEGKRIALSILDLASGDKGHSIHVEEIIKCHEDVMYFKDNYLLFLDKNELQDKFIKGIVKNKRVKIISDRGTMQTTSALIYILHKYNFSSHKNIAIVSTSLSSSADHINKLTYMFNELPNWIKVKGKLLKRSMKSDCNVSIVIDTVSHNAFRGMSLDVLFIDALDWIKPDKFSEFLEGVIPAMISRDYKIIAIGDDDKISDFTKIDASLPVRVERRTFKQIIKDIIVDLYNRIKE